MAPVALDAAAETAGLRVVPATVNAVIERQVSVDFSPFVRAWNALESDDRVLVAACAMAGVDAQVEAAIQWRDTMMTFAAQLRPVLVRSG